MSRTASEESLSSINDASFVILSSGSFPNHESDKDPHKSSDSEALVNRKSKNTDFESEKSSVKDGDHVHKSSLSEENIQSKLNELVKENLNLKETLNHNNLAIKSQLDTFFTWQQDILRTHETHKQKLLETKDLILKLREENLSLKKQLEEASEGFSVITDVDTFDQLPNEPKESDVFKERIQEFKSICNELANKKEDLIIEKQKFVEELSDFRNEILRLKKELKEATKESLLMSQKSEISQQNSGVKTSSKSLSDSETYAQINSLFKQLEEKRDEILKLEMAENVTTSKSSDASRSQISPTDEPNHCTDRTNEVKDSLNVENQKLNDYKSWVTVAEENKRNEEMDYTLMHEVKEFKTCLNLEENDFKEKQGSVEALKKQFIILLDHYKTLQKQLNALHNENQNIEIFKKEVVSISAELQAKNKELISKQQECNDLKELLAKTNSEWNEKYSVLQIQADLQRNDFDYEKAAKEQLLEEKRQMADQIKFLESHIEELEKSKGTSHYKGSSLASTEKMADYKCPLCFTSFSNVTNLEDHTNYCCIELYP